ncbi:MAG: aminotransferase class I/II-fold pyridoxal phosphate-dependent enzyme, partial [Candidatus Bathyarchaeia archaeon]
SPLWLIHQHTIACINSIAQYVALAALEGPQDFVKEMVSEFDRRRRMVYERLDEIGGFNCTLPKGAFYVFPNIKDFGMPSEQFAEYLARQASVLTVPGSSFGRYGEGYIRVSYAAAYEQLEEAMSRIERAVRKLR